VSDALELSQAHRSPFNHSIFRQKGPAHRRASNKACEKEPFTSLISNVDFGQSLFLMIKPGNQLCGDGGI
jgi:hypothetical protein